MASTAPEPEIFVRSHECENDLAKLVDDLGYAEAALSTASKKRDDITQQIQEAERQLSEVRADVTADRLGQDDKGGSNKEARDANVALALSKNEKHANFDRQVRELKIDQRNAVTDSDMALSRVKSLHRRVDACVARAGLIRAQLDTLACLTRYDTVKLSMGARPAGPTGAKQ